jgi:hypothetical protein
MRAAESRAPSRTFPFVFPTFVATRAILFAVALFAVLRMPINAVEAQGFHLAPQPHAYLEAWARYDACWYMTIAERGYRAPIGSYGDMRPNFFPLFPVLVTAIIPLARIPLLAGLIASNACYLVFLLLLWRLICLDWSPDVARRATWIYLLFPSAFFLSGAYSESLLLAVVAGALLAARRKRWLLAGVLAALATLARPVGIAAVVPIVFEYLTEHQTAAAGGDHPAGIWLRLLLPTLLAVAGYLVFASTMFGDPMATVTGQASIRGPVAAPLHAFDSSLIDAALAVIALATLPAVYSRVRPSYACYSLLVVLIPLSGSLMSFNRLLLPSFPHAILLARAVKAPWAVTLVLVSFAMLEAVTMAAFATWNWVA